MQASAFHSAVESASQHLQQGDVEQAFSAMAPFAASATEDRDRAISFLNLWRLAPGRVGLLAEVTRLADSFPEDADVVMAACDALIRDAERLAPDQPPPAQGAAHTAARLAQHCLEHLVTAGELSTETHAYLQMCLGNALRLAHLYERAVSAMKSALEKRPEHGPWWFNLGLAHKQQGDFAAGLAASSRARELLGDQKSVLWNVAICATACGQGAVAVDAFGAMGLGAYLGAGGMPQVDHMPPVQVRVATVGPGHMGPSVVPDRAVGFELVWVSPLSPCHGVVQTATYRQGSVDYGDVVLWDAVPVGTTSWEGKTTPRFPLLARLAAGKERRFRFVALQRQPGAIEALRGELPLGGQLFVHREQIEQPEPNVAETGALDEQRHVYGKVVVPHDVDLVEFKKVFEARVAEAQVELVMPELLEALGDTAAAGKAHTLWRGIERTAEKAKAH